MLIVGVIVVLDRSSVFPPTDTTDNTNETDDRDLPKPLSADVKAYIDSKADLIVLDQPEAGSAVDSPLTISGKARGYWFFEASFPVMIVNWDGLIIGSGIATAEGDWMTEEFVPFTATINFSSSYTDESPDFMRRGALILKKDNPSGLPENDDALEIPINFVPEPLPTPVSSFGPKVTIYDGIAVPAASQTLDLSGRNLSGSLKAEIRLLTNLEVLNLSQNQFTGLPAEVGQLSKLRVLNLSNNPFTGLPHELGNLSNLELLDLRGTNYAKADLDIIKGKLPKATQIIID